MKIARLRNLEKVVKEVLEEDDLARKDDCQLILRVIQKIYPNELSKTFLEVMRGAKSKGISFESITRARRKLQNKYPWLKDEKIAEKRNIEQEEYRAYSRE